MLQHGEGSVAGWHHGRRIWLAWGVAGLLVAALVVWRQPLFGGNFGVVETARVFRAAQPKRNLERLIRDYRLASILNLRGGSRADDWYEAEVSASRDKGVAFYDLPLSATQRPTRRDLLTLLDLFERCRYPLLIHCKSGSDRTGMASALYLLCQKNASPQEALQAFSLRFGHIPIFGTDRLHEPFLEYSQWLQVHGLTHTPARLRAWVEHDYRATDPVIAFQPLKPGPRTGEPTSRWVPKP